MALRKRNPTSAGRRFQTVADFSEVTTSTPEKSLLAPKPGSGGRNSYGRKTGRHRGGGHKQQYRIIDFRRNKDDIPAKVATIEYDPNRNARIALLHYLDGEKRYILATARVGVGDLLQSGQGSEIRKAVEAIFGVRVVNVNTLTRLGKRKRSRRAATFGRRPDTKRAVVTLSAGSRIDLFET